MIPRGFRKLDRAVENIAGSTHQKRSRRASKKHDSQSETLKPISSISATSYEIMVSTGGIIMSMNSFSFKLRSADRDEAPASQCSENTSVTGITKLRENEAAPINMEQLRAKYKDAVGAGRRIAPRFPLRMTAIVYARGKSLRLKSVNISLSGVLLNKNIPREFAGDDLDIVFIHEHPGSTKKQYMMFRGQVVDGAASSPRLRFSGAVKTASKDLEAIIQRSQLAPL